MFDRLAEGHAQSDGERFLRHLADSRVAVEFLNVTRPGLDWHFRLFDLLFVVLSAPTVLILAATIALIIKVNDPRAPVFFFQTRYGRFGKPFKIVKFRTMVPNADAYKPLLLDQAEDQGAGFKLSNDPRVTACGRFLRKSYLDELPQLWNVLRGDMAIVGPRANSTDPAALEAWQRLRLIVRPGITGSWQAMRSKPTNFEERCRIDIEYIEKKSLRTDIAILFRTAMIMVVRPTGC